MTFATHRRRFVLKLAVIGASVIALPGCTGGMANIFGPRTPAVEQIRVPQPGPTRPRTAENTATPKLVRIVDTTQRQDIALSATYHERILVPVGSGLVLQAQSGGNRPPAIRAIKTEGGPPYALSLPVDTGKDAYPMTVQATLTSTIGHVLTGTVTLREKPKDPVEIVMRTSAAAPSDSDSAAGKAE